MEDLKKAILVRNGKVIGAVGDKIYTSTPIGVVQAFSGTTVPNGYLLADGTSYPTTDYPDLYAVIGNTYGGDSTNFNVPDYRETVLVGVGENTTDTIAVHDVYGLGEFKDDQFQGHWHNLGNSNGTVTVALGASAKGGSVMGANPGGENRYSVEKALDAIADGTNSEPRKGTTTHGKQKGVTYIIKAFHTNEGVDSGVSDDVIGYINDKLADCITTQGGIVSGAISFKSAENGYCGITKHHDEDIDYGMLIQDTDKDGNICAIKLSAANTNASIVCKHGEDVVTGELLHTGNINQHIGANIPKTNFEFTNTTNWSIPNSNLETCYLVRNGLCFLHIAAHCNIVANDNNSTVFVGLPNPVLQVYSSFAGVDCDPCQLTVTPNGSLFLRGGTAGKDYTFSFVYPVA